MSDGVGVVIPCHNAARWLGEAVGSVFAQTRPATQLVLVDDSSTDRTPEVIQDLIAEAPIGLEVTTLRVSQRNAAATRNAGIERLQTEWVAFLDADDRWLPGHLEQALTALGPRDVAYMANHHWIDDDGQRLPLPEGMRHKIGQTRGGLSAQAFVDALSVGFHFGHSTVVVSRERTAEIGSFDPKFVRRHDLDHWLRLIADHTWAYGAEPAAEYRVTTPGSLSKDAVTCELYYLRALQRSRYRLPSPAYESLVQTSAKRALSLAFEHGNADQRQAALDQGQWELGPGFRWAYRLGHRAPGVLSGLVSLKRRLGVTL